LIANEERRITVNETLSHRKDRIKDLREGAKNKIDFDVHQLIGTMCYRLFGNVEASGKDNKSGSLVLNTGGVFEGKPLL